MLDKRNYIARVSIRDSGTDSGTTAVWRLHEPL